MVALYGFLTAQFVAVLLASPLIPWHRRRTGTIAFAVPKRWARAGPLIVTLASVLRVGLALAVAIPPDISFLLLLIFDVVVGLLVLLSILWTMDQLISSAKRMARLVLRLVQYLRPG